MTNKQIPCGYCGAENPAGSNRCIACGAPVEVPASMPVRVTTTNTPAGSTSSNWTRTDTTTEQINDAVDATPLSQELKDGLKAASAGLGALGVGSFLYRTIAEAAAIAFSSFLVGYASGSARIFYLAVIGGIVLGLAVGSVVKRSLWVMLSAPVGSILGMLAALLANSFDPSVFWSPILAMIGGTLFAFIGSRRRSKTGLMKWYERIRPVLGMVGGLVFALLGYLAGSLIH